VAEHYETLLLDRVGTDGRVGRITLNRPDRMNTLSKELFREFDEALHDYEADQSVRVIIVRGSGRGFSAGYDLTPGYTGGGARSYKQQDEQGRPLVINTRTDMQQITDVLMYFWNMAKVTIAQVHGWALAGGCELAMMADLVVAAEDAQLGHPALRGLGTAREGIIWPLVIGMRKAKELFYTGDTVSGVEAERIGMINYAWPAEQLDDRTIAFADHVANMSADHLALLKITMNRFYENMGIYSSVRSATDLDAMGRMTEQGYAFMEKMIEALRSGKSLKTAFEWRDAPYREYRAKG